MLLLVVSDATAAAAAAAAVAVALFCFRFTCNFICSSGINELTHVFVAIIDIDSESVTHTIFSSLFSKIYFVLVSYNTTQHNTIQYNTMDSGRSSVNASISHEIHFDCIDSTKCTIY